MNNIDFLIKQQHLYGSKQKQFFLRKSIKLEEEVHSYRQPLVSPRKQNKFILQLQDVDLTLIRKALINEYFIEILELKECRLKCVPIEILEMERLKVLKLESNYIKEAPSIEVETLSLRNNLLTIYHAGQSVIKLDISMNKIKEFSVGDKLQDLIVFANEFIQLPKLSQQLKSLELDWFKYTEPPMKSLQVQPLIAAVTVQSFTAIEFLNYYSLEQIKNKIKEAAIAQDLGIVTSMAQCMDINEGEQDTALSLALKAESLFAVRHLLDLGADISKGYYPQGNILSYCIDQDLPAIINIILGKCTKEIFSVDNVGNSPLHYLSKVEYNESSFKILMKAKQLEIQLQENMLGQSPIYLAIVKFKNQLLRLFLVNFEFDASDLFNATAKSENWEACLILIEHNVDFNYAQKLLVVRNVKFYKTLQCYEYFWIRQFILREQPKFHFNYEVKLLSKGNKIIKSENSYLRQLRQFIMLKSILNKQQKQFLIQQMVQRLNDVQNQDFDYFQILTEIVLTLHFQIDKTIQDHLFNMLKHYIIGQEYLFKYIRRPFRPTDIQLQYEYYQQ